MPGVGKAIFCRISYFAAPRHLPFYTRWSFVPASPARGLHRTTPGEKGPRDKGWKDTQGADMGSHDTTSVWALAVPSLFLLPSHPHSSLLRALFCQKIKDFSNTESQTILKLLPASPMAMRHCLEFPPHYSYVAFSPLIKRQHLRLLPDYTPELLVRFPGSLFTFQLIFNLLCSNLKYLHLMPLLRLQTWIHWHFPETTHWLQ